MSKKIISISLLCIIAVVMMLTFAGCTGLFPTQTTTGEGVTETTEPPTGWRAIFANYGTWIWLAVLAVAFYFLLIRPQRVRSKKAKDLMSAVKRGDEVVTIGGFHGRVKDVRDDTVIITIAGGVDVKITKSAIARVVTSQGIAETDNKLQ
jgi:preprotein translocase subunit YajC